jgi:hypothetical protein
MAVQPAATTRPWRIKKLNVEVRDSDGVITLPGTKFMVTYHKPKDVPQLMSKSD